MTAAAMVPRQGPGDLGPGLDMEDRDAPHAAATSQTIEVVLYDAWINQNFNDDYIDGTGIINLNFDSDGNPDSAKVVAPLGDKIAAALSLPPLCVPDLTE